MLSRRSQLRLAVAASAALAPAWAAAAEPTPGAEIWISDTMLESLFDQEIATSAPFSGLILGNWVSGTSSTTTKSTVVLEPNASTAVLRMEVAAQVAADASSHTDAPFNTQVWAQMKSQSYVHATKRFYLQPARFSAVTRGETAATTATTPAEITSLNVGTTGLFKRIKSVIVYRAAWQQIWASRLQTQELTNARVADEFRRQFDAETGRVVDDANAKIYQQIYHPIVDSGALPGHPFVMTSAEHLQMGVYDPSPDATAATRPIFPRKYAVHLRLRASYLEMAARHALAGQTTTEAELNAQIKKLTGKDQPVVDEASMLALTYHDDKPLSLKVDGGKIVLTLRVKAVKRGPRDYPPLITRVTYELVKSPAGAFELQRQGDVEVLPPRGENDPAVPLTLQEKSEQQFVRKKLRETLFTEVLDISKLTAPAGLGDNGSLFTKLAVADGGWLAFGLERTP